MNVLAGACHISQSAWNHYDNIREWEHPDSRVEGEDAGMKHGAKERNAKEKRRHETRWMT